MVQLALLLPPSHFKQKNPKWLSWQQSSILRKQSVKTTKLVGVWNPKALNTVGCVFLSEPNPSALWKVTSSCEPYSCSPVNTRNKLADSVGFLGEACKGSKHHLLASAWKRKPGIFHLVAHLFVCAASSFRANTKKLVQHQKAATCLGNPSQS